MSASAEPIGEESALDVCRNRKGDCTEYAVFLCALCRAASIPCRTVTGLVYTRGIWGLHEWVEVLIGDDWWPLDATIGRGFVDALHLTMTREAADGIGSISEWIATRQAFGNLGVSIESLTLRGRKLPDLERKDRALPDGRHVDSVLGIAYRVPDGMEGHVPALPARGVLVIARPGASQNDFSMRIEFTEASVILDWDRITMAKELKVPPVIRDGFVDGRPARIETFDDDVTVRHVWVQDEDILYDFSAHNIREEADSRAFDAFVESLDLDAVPPD